MSPNQVDTPTIARVQLALTGAIKERYWKDIYHTANGVLDHLGDSAARTNYTTTRTRSQRNTKSDQEQTDAQLQLRRRKSQPKKCRMCTVCCHSLACVIPALHGHATTFPKAIC